MGRGLCRNPYLRLKKEINYEKENIVGRRDSIALYVACFLASGMRRRRIEKGSD